MKNIFRKNAIVLFCLLTCAGYSQRASVTFRGGVYDNGIPVAGVHVYIMDAGARKSELITDSTGKFEVESYFNKMIYINFVKEGYVAQRTWANTRIRNMDQSNMRMKFDFKLIQQPKDGRILVFKDPVGKIKFNYEKGKFQFDMVYHAKVKPKLEALLNSIVVKTVPEKSDSIILVSP